ncbi:DUF4194 domain-containing protein [Verrucomicrobiota bacterium sgz303538]
MTPVSLPQQLTETEQENLREAIQRLLAHGAILREDHRDLYDWCKVHRVRVDDLAALIGLRLQWEEASRLIVALPMTARLRRRLRQDETLIVMALWYDFDRAVQEDGLALDEVEFPVRTFMEALESKFRQLRLPSETRLREILQFCERKSLIRLRAAAGPFADAVIRVLPGIRFVIPFPDLNEWQRQHERIVQAGATTTPTEEESTDAEPQD